jgi:hypothetical protein
MAGWFVVLGALVIQRPWRWGVSCMLCLFSGMGRELIAVA